MLNIAMDKIDRIINLTRNTCNHTTNACQLPNLNDLMLHFLNLVEWPQAAELDLERLWWWLEALLEFGRLANGNEYGQSVQWHREI